MSSIVKALADSYPEMTLYPDLEEALVGICRTFGREPVAIYDYEKCIEIRMRDGMSYEEAVEFHEFNTMGSYVGEFTPAFLIGPSLLEESLP